MKIVCEERTDEGLRFFKDGCIGTIRTIDGGGDKRVIEVNRLGNIYGEDKGTGYAGNVWDKESLCPTLTTMQGGNREPMIVVSRGRNPQNPSDRTPGAYVEQRLEPNSEGICNTLTSVQKDNLVLEPCKYRIRKLTPRECWRLMDFPDKDYDKAAAVNSNTQLYKQAGNSIVRAVLMAIFKQML